MLYKVSKNNVLATMEYRKKILEKNVQDIVGENLGCLLGLEKVQYQFSVEGKFIDILAFDKEANAPVIIELKRENDTGLFDQGMEYFNLLSNRKNDFLIKLHEVLNIPADPKAIDWSSSRVIFIGRNFTQRQRRAVDFKGIPIELYDYDWFEDGFFKLEPVGLEKRASLEIQGVGNDKKDVERVKSEFKEYLVEDHFKEGWEEIRSIFDDLKRRILSIDDRVEEHVRKYYIGYRMENFKWNLCVVHVQKSKLKLGLIRVERKDLQDPEQKIITVPWRENGWGKSCDIEIKKRSDIDYALFLIRQVYEKFYK